MTVEQLPSAAPCSPASLRASPSESVPPHSVRLPGPRRAGPRGGRPSRTRTQARTLDYRAAVTVTVLPQAPGFGSPIKGQSRCFSLRRFNGKSSQSGAHDASAERHGVEEKSLA
jgi:hypothetical protein